MNEKYLPIYKREFKGTMFENDYIEYMQQFE